MASSMNNRTNGAGTALEARKTENDFYSAYTAKPIAEIINNGFFTVNRQWNVLYWNKAAEKLLKIPAERVIGRNLWEIFEGSVSLSFYKQFHEAPISEIPDHFSVYWPQKNAWFEGNSYHDAETLSISFKNNADTTSISAPSTHALQFRQLNEMYRKVLDVTNDCLWEWNLETKEIFWIDGGHKRVFGYPIENSLIPQHYWESLIHPDDKKRVLDSVAAYINHPSTNFWEIEYRFKRANGEYAYVCDRGQMLAWGGEKSAMLVGATQDKTAQTLANLNLNQSERILRLVAKQTVNGIVMTDAEQKIIWVNTAFTRITGYEIHEVFNRRPGDFLQGEDTDPETVAYLRRQMKNLEPFDCTILNYNKAGHKYWVHIQGQALLNKEGKCERFFAMQTDITEKVKMEKTLIGERLERQKAITSAVHTAQENERSAIGREMHDNLNQILGAAKLYVEMAKTDEVQLEMCLDKASTYILTVIDEIRKISKALVTPVLVVGLLDSIQILIDDLLPVDPIEIELQETDVYETLLDEKLQLVLFRIVQEQLQNILKHANASNATIQVLQTERSITLIITDNGTGCDLNI
ncbi:MAG TPA: PAS domain S-box protein, partial [Flavitalea sp.]|nr:PAS domain S-box protein [Flavitalea sp.]